MKPGAVDQRGTLSVRMAGPFWSTIASESAFANSWRKAMLPRCPRRLPLRPMTRKHQVFPCSRPSCNNAAADHREKKRAQTLQKAGWVGCSWNRALLHVFTGCAHAHACACMHAYAHARTHAHRGIESRSDGMSDLEFVFHLPCSDCILHLALHCLHTETCPVR
jgi:hypothetical protein